MLILEKNCSLASLHLSTMFGKISNIDIDYLDILVASAKGSEQKASESLSRISAI